MNHRFNSSMWLRIVVILCAALTAYFLMLQDIKSEIATKADADVLHRIDNKLSGLEASEREYQITTREFREFRAEVIARLVRIESLIEKTGEQ